MALAMLVGFASGCSDDDDSSSATTSSAPGDTAGAEGSDGGDDRPTSTSTFAEAVPEDEWPELTEVEQTFADAVIEDLGPEDQPAILPGADNACLAVHWVAAIGEEVLVDSGMTPEEFVSEGPPAMGIDRGTAEAMIDSMEYCGAPLDQFYAEWAQVFGVDPDTQPEIVECMQEAMSVEEFRELLIASFTGEESDALNSVQDEFQACMPTDG